MKKRDIDQKKSQGQKFINNKFPCHDLRAAWWSNRKSWLQFLNMVSVVFMYRVPA